MTESSTLGYGVLNQSKNEFVQKDGEILFGSKSDAEDLKEHMENNELEVVSVHNSNFEMEEAVAIGEVIEYQQEPDKITAYVRAGSDVYAVHYKLESYSVVENYTPFN